MRHRVLADALVVIHFAFIAFVIGGGLLVRWKRWLALLHLPAVAWAAWIELSGAICPLTPWEQAALVRAGEAGYRGGFIEHYLAPIIYPAGLTPSLQLALGAFVLVVNAAVYGLMWHRRKVSQNCRERPECAKARSECRDST